MYKNSHWKFRIAAAAALAPAIAIAQPRLQHVQLAGACTLAASVTAGGIHSARDTSPSITVLPTTVFRNTVFALSLHAFSGVLNGEAADPESERLETTCHLGLDPRYVDTLLVRAGGWATQGIDVSFAPDGTGVGVAFDQFTDGIDYMWTPPPITDARNYDPRAYNRISWFVTVSWG